MYVHLFSKSYNVQFIVELTIYVSYFAIVEVEGYLDANCLIN